MVVGVEEIFPRVRSESSQNKKTLECDPRPSLMLTLSVPAGGAVTKMNDGKWPAIPTEYAISYLEMAS